MHAGEIIISVWNCHSALSRYEAEQGGFVVVPAANWQALEDEALAEVEAQGGAFTQSGHYQCSPELAQKARFPE